MTTTKRNDRPTTTEVQQFAHFTREGDIIPHGWNKHIGKGHTGKSLKTGEAIWVWRSHPFAERLLARIIFFYTPTPVKNESGDVIDWRRKFDGDYWRIKFDEMALALGCSDRTIKDELALLVELGLVRTTESRKRTTKDGIRALPVYVIPIYDAIVNITSAGQPVKKLHRQPSEETSLAASEETSPEPVKKLHPSSFSVSLKPKTLREEKIAANAAPLESQSSNQTQPEPEGEPAIGTSSPLQQSPTHDDVPPAPPQNPPAPTPRARNVMFDKLAALTHTTSAMAGPQIGKLIKQLKASNYDESHIDLFEVWWCQDWRSADKQGNRGIVPTVGQIGQLFGVAMAWADKHAPKAPIVETLTPEQEAELEAKLIAEYKAREDELDRRREAAGWAK